MVASSRASCILESLFRGADGAEETTPQKQLIQSELQAHAAGCCLFGVRVVDAQIQGLRREGLTSAPPPPPPASLSTTTALLLQLYYYCFPPLLLLLPAFTSLYKTTSLAECGQPYLSEPADHGAIPQFSKI